MQLGSISDFRWILSLSCVSTAGASLLLGRRLLPLILYVLKACHTVWMKKGRRSLLVSRLVFGFNSVGITVYDCERSKLSDVDLPVYCFLTLKMYIADGVVTHPSCNNVHEHSFPPPHFQSNLNRRLIKSPLDSKGSRSLHQSSTEETRVPWSLLDFSLSEEDLQKLWGQPARNTWPNTFEERSISNVETGAKYAGSNVSQ